MKKPWYKNKLIWIIGIPILIILIATPFIINYLYMKGTPDGKADTSFSASDMLSFYGSVLAFLGTVALGGLALWQNKKANAISKELLDLEWKRNQPCFDVVCDKKYTIYLGEEIEKYKNKNNIYAMLYIEPLFISIPRSEITTSVALIEMEIKNSGNSDIRQMCIKKLDCYLGIYTPKNLQCMHSFYGNSQLKKGESRKFIIDFTQEVIDDIDKETNWIFKSINNMMPRISLNLHIISADGYEYDEIIELDSGFFPPLNNSGMILERMFYLEKVKITRSNENE